MEIIPVIDRVKERIESTGITITAISKQTKIKYGRLQKWITEGFTPKLEDSKILEDWLAGKVVNNEDDNSKLEQEAVIYETKNKDLSLQAIVNLTTTNQTLANNSSRLISLLEEKEKKVTAGVQPESFAIAPETVQALLQVFGEVATGKRWKSKAEFEAYVNTLSFDKIMRKQAAGK